MEEDPTEQQQHGQEEKGPRQGTRTRWQVRTVLYIGDTTGSTVERKNFADENFTILFKSALYLVRDNISQIWPNIYSKLLTINLVKFSQLSAIYHSIVSAPCLMQGIGYVAGRWLGGALGVYGCIL